MILLDLKSSILREVSACSRDPKAVLFHLAKFSWRPWSWNLYSCFFSPYMHIIICSIIIWLITEYEFLPFIFWFTSLTTTDLLNCLTFLHFISLSNLVISTSYLISQVEDQPYWFWLWVNKRCFSSLIGNYNPGYMLNICDDSDFHRLLILLNKHLFYLLIDLLTFSTYISDLNALAVKELDNMMLFLWSHDSKFVVCMTIWNCTCSFLTQTIIYSTSCNTQQLDKITIKW